MPPQKGEVLNIPRVIPRNWVLGESKAEWGRLADTCTLSFGRVLRKYEASLTARRGLCAAARRRKLTLHLSLSPKQRWAPHGDEGVQRSHSAGRIQSSFQTAPGSRTGGFQPPGAAFGCLGPSLNRGSAICWPTPLSTEDPWGLLAPAQLICWTGRNSGPEAKHSPGTLRRKHHHLPKTSPVHAAPPGLRAWEARNCKCGTLKPGSISAAPSLCGL